MSLGIKDSSLRLYMCHHVEEGEKKRHCCLPFPEIVANCALSARSCRSCSHCCELIRKKRRGHAQAGSFCSARMALAAAAEDLGASYKWLACLPVSHMISTNTHRRSRAASSWRKNISAAQIVPSDISRSYRRWSAIVKVFEHLGGGSGEETR